MKDWMKKESEYKDDIESLKAFAEYDEEQLKQSPSEEFKSEFKKLNGFNDPKNKLRDQFAMQAMNALIIAHNGTYIEIYHESYHIADKMLKSRKEVSGE